MTKKSTEKLYLVADPEGDWNSTEAVKAKSPEEAIEIVMKGDLSNNLGISFAVWEVTSPTPEVFIVAPELVRSQ